MRTAHLVLAGAILLASTAAFAAPNDPNADPSNCGFVHRNGHLVYLGACPGPTTGPSPVPDDTPAPRPT